MPTERSHFHIRQTEQADIAALRQILNDIIAIGGTTALESPLSIAAFNEYFLTGLGCIACFTAESSEGKAVGFQSLTRNAQLPADWADIATFTQRKPVAPGAGTALFQTMALFARDFGLAAINATIRADNDAGIPYYEKMGFRTYKVTPAVPLKNRAPVDRIWKRYDLSRR
jgi:L-amino acid N-acyltransferase YncA